MLAQRMKLTRREKHLLIAAALIVLYFVFNPARIPEDQEIFYLLVIVVPLGFYLATDPEHKRKGNHERD
jgi:hypothetical protein